MKISENLIKDTRAESISNRVDKAEERISWTAGKIVKTLRLCINKEQRERKDPN